jgi:hypothetical protein
MFVLAGCGQFNFPTEILFPDQQGGLTTAEVANGLKEALRIGAQNSTSKASNTNGFYGNSLIRIPFPEEAIKVKNTITDAMGILQGGDNAATSYLRGKTYSQLKNEFSPIVKQSIDRVKVTSYWNPIATNYNRLTLLTGGEQVNPNLENYITEKAIDGLFKLVAEEEAKIRKDPAARVTEILKKVFGQQ